MKVVFRVDASIQIGTGHVMRCLTLADALNRNNVKCHFICREHNGNLISLVEEREHKVHKLFMVNSNDYSTIKEITDSDSSLSTYSKWLGTNWETDAEQTSSILKHLSPDWLVVDNYGLDFRWESAVKKYCSNLLAIDDIANRRHDCDLLLDQTFGRKESEYNNLVLGSPELLLGSQYALLRPEFSEWREYSLKRRAKPQLKQILVSLGGVDQDNVTAQVLEALNSCELSNDVNIIVVLGITAPHLEAVKQQANSMRISTEVKVNIKNMAEVMANSDLAIGASGSTTWERCCLGLPSIQIVTAKNQEYIAQVLTDINAVYSIKQFESLKLCEKLAEISRYLTKLSLLSSAIVTGKGVFDVVNMLLKKTQQDNLLLKPISNNDCEYLYNLQTIEGIRKYFRESKIPKPLEHKKWFVKAMNSCDQAVFVLVNNKVNIGMIRLDGISNGNLEISLIIDPKYAGLGFAQKAIRKILSLIPGRKVKARVHVDNVVSQRVFEKSGFELLDRSQKFWMYLKNV